jgi:hypothetical protein
VIQRIDDKLKDSFDNNDQELFLTILPLNYYFDSMISLNVLQHNSIDFYEFDGEWPLVV